MPETFYLIKMLVSDLIHAVVCLGLLPSYLLDPVNWEWDAESRATWKTACKHWPDFRAKWYGAPELVDPNSLSLEPLPPSTLDPSISSSILVRESSVTMFHTVWGKAMQSAGKQGVIITGQPGTGKYLLSCIHYCVTNRV